MIGHLRGRLLFKNPQLATIEAGGIGYDVAISIPTFTALPAEGGDVSLHIHTHVREDALVLYGFPGREEKRLFERLITVSGVGPKLAITILSGLTAEKLVAALRSQDHASLTRIPGVGKKLAERLVVELKDKLDDMASTPPHGDTGPWTDDVLSALVNLGYQRQLAEKAIAAAVNGNKQIAQSFENLFRAALAAIGN